MQTIIYGCNNSGFQGWNPKVYNRSQYTMSEFLTNTTHLQKYTKYNMLHMFNNTSEAYFTQFWKGEKQNKCPRLEKTTD